MNSLYLGVDACTTLYVSHSGDFDNYSKPEYNMQANFVSKKLYFNVRFFKKTVPITSTN